MIGIVILNYNTWQKTVTCLQSIYETYKDRKIIVVVDNCSTNDSFERLSEVYNDKDNYPEICIIRTDKNGGFSYGNNFGFLYLVSSFPEIDKIVITNNDIVFKKHAIYELIKGFEFSNNVVMTGPSIYNLDGTKTNAPWKFKPNVWQELGLMSKKCCAYTWDEVRESRTVYQVTGCCFAVRKDLFILMGMLDDKVFLYNEENIYCKRISDLGLQIVYCPKSIIIHEHGSTTGNKSIFVDKEFVKSSLYFYSTYERLNKFSILFIKAFYIFRISLKMALFRYDNSKGYLKALKEIIMYNRY